MSELERKIVAFDGLSLAGKSTMVAMTHERTGATVIRENALDPYRPTISRLNRLIKESDPHKAVEQTIKEFPESQKVLNDAIDYASVYEGSPKTQALLAYMFAMGRKVVDTHVREVVAESDVILDRWQITGWAYQVDKNGYRWQDIMKLNEELGILLPDVQIILTCPKDEIPQRKAYREKQGVGTAGQMSSGRENIILSAFDAICADSDLNVKTRIYRFENKGVPTPDLKEQIKQAIPTFQAIERILRNSGFSIESDQIVDSETYWVEPARLERIYKRQTS